MLEPVLSANGEHAKAFGDPDGNASCSLAGVVEVATADPLIWHTILAQCSADGCDLHLTRAARRVEPCDSAASEDSKEASVLEEISLEVAGEGVSTTALAWLPDPSEEMQPEQRSQPLLCLGFSHGGVTVFSPGGKPCFSFLICQRPVISLRVGPSKQLLVLHAGNVLASVSLTSCAKRAAEADGHKQEECEEEPEDSDEDSSTSSEELWYDIYELRDREATADICMLSHCRPLEDVFQSTESAACAVAVGTRPFLSQHFVSQGSSVRSLIGNAASTALSYAKSWMSVVRPFSGRVAQTSGLGDATGGFDPLAAPVTLPPAGLLRASEIQVPRQPPTALPAGGRFIDASRVGEILSPAPPPLLRPEEVDAAPAASLAAVCDEFGRVGLFCLETLRCLHLWKGYRDAQVAWLREPVAACPEHGEGKLRGQGGALGLVIYAPRRGLLELWVIGGADSSLPRRIDAVAVDLDCHLLACTIGLQPSAHLLRPSGRLECVRWHRSTAVSSISVTPAPASEADSDAFDSVSSNPEEGDGQGPVFTGPDASSQTAAVEAEM